MSPATPPSGLLDAPAPDSFPNLMSDVRGGKQAYPHSFGGKRGFRRGGPLCLVGE